VVSRAVLFLLCSGVFADTLERASIYVPPGSGPLVHAASDLASDIEKVTGQRPRIASNCDAPCIALLDVSSAGAKTKLAEWAPEIAKELEGKWEGYRVVAKDGRLLIAGSDERGTMWGLYSLSEKVLGVDPMGFWTDRFAAKKQSVPMAGIALSSDGPTYRFRGWFLNDEDLLTEWKPGGVRRLEYPFYSRVISRELAQKVFETMLRLRMNLVIPASFVDIHNPAEEMLIEEASKRGLYVSMHHVEPLGVSAFGFQNYFARKGDRTPFSFVTQRDAFREVWRSSAKRWAKYPNVIWQLGLRGIADRPVWVTDSNVPPDDAGRGKLISDAIAEQWSIVREVDKRSRPLATTTLWMEGAKLHQAGHLKFPDGVTVVFADNGPGDRWEPDFFSVTRQPGRRYGVYQHHAFWSRGPHLVQGLSPEYAHKQMKLAYDKGDREYAILNVANIREFALGVAASSEMLFDFGGFQPDAFLSRWVRDRYTAPEAETAYRELFSLYPKLIDGDLLAAAKRRAAGGNRVPDCAALPSVAKARAAAIAAWKVIPQGQRPLFETNLLAQTRMMHGLREAACAGELMKALEAVNEIRSGMSLAARGSWRDWYRGDRKMAIAELEAAVRHNVDQAYPAKSGDAEIRHFTYGKGLKAILAWPKGSTDRLPLLVLMHGFRGQARDFQDATLARFATSYGKGVFVAAVSMRGRDGSPGTPDAGGAEIEDIRDAVLAIQREFASQVEPGNVHIAGYSGGGGNTMSAVARFPDLFRTATAFFGISDYALWYTQANPDQRKFLMQWTGSTEAMGSRDVCSKLAAYPGVLRLYHDREDNNVPVLHSERALGCRPWSHANFSSAEDTLRWVHQNPNSDAPVRQAEREFLLPISLWSQSTN
jgi:pimeloyl-ACP methyl ester carboxylesterase